MAYNGDPVVADGRRIGFVTSCAIDSERFLTGQAFLETPYTKLDTPILIHQGGVMDRPAHGGEGGKQVREVVKSSNWN